jgi:hypothetical protein
MKQWTRASLLVVSAMALMTLLFACNKGEPPADTKPTTNNPNAYPGMEQVKGRATLRPNAGGEGEGKGK